jgi:hypothetical protein
MIFNIVVIKILHRLPIVKGWLIRERSIQEEGTLLNLFQGSFSHIYNYFSTALISKMDILEW